MKVSETKEMVIDFQYDKCEMDPIVIIEKPAVEIVESFKFLETRIANDLGWHARIGENLKKSRPRLYFLRKLKLFSVSQRIFINFYCCVIETCLFGSILT